MLKTEQEWVKVHAAEYLLWLGQPAGVQDIYQNELRKFATKSPYRIGIWRVLAQAATTPQEKKKWTDAIAEAFKDPNGPDRIHAAETLAKLGISPITVDAEATRKALAGDNPALALYTLWGATLADPETLPTNRQTFLNLAIDPTEEVARRKLGAFILRRLGGLNSADWQKIARSALNEPPAAGARLSLLHTALVTAPGQATDSEEYHQVRTQLLAAQHSPATGDQLELTAALAEKGTLADVPVLTPLLKHENADVRAGAAYAILKIGSK